MSARQLVVALLSVALLASWSTEGLAQGIDSYVASDTIRLGETVEYVVELHEPVAEITPPESSDFRVVAQSTRTNVRVINGQAERQLSYTFRLAPLRTGQLATGAVRVRLADGTIVRGTSFDITVRDEGATVGRARHAPSAPPAPVQPRRAWRSPSTSLKTPPKTDDAAADDELLPSVPKPGSADMFASGVPADIGEAPFIIAAISDDEPYVGEQVVVDYMLFAPVTGFGMNFEGLTEPEFSDFWFEDITDSRRGSRSSMLGSDRVHGRMYEVHLLRSFLILPLQSGEVIVPPIGLDVSGASFFRRTTSRTLESPPLQISVRPLPEDGRPAGFRDGNVGRFELHARLDHDSLRAGDTGRISVSLNGIGLPSRVVAPDVSLPSGLRSFPADGSVRKALSELGWMTLRVDDSVSFSPEREGTFEFAPVQFSYFDPWKEEYETLEASLPALTVSGTRPGAASARESQASHEQAEKWLIALPAPRPVNESPRRVTRLHPFVGGSGFYALLAMPFLLFVFTAGFRRFRRYREQTAPERAIANAGKTAQRRLAAIDPDEGGRETYSEIAAVLRRYVAAKTERPTLGATLPQLRETAGQFFGRAGFQLADLVTDAEQARYGSPESAPDPAELRQRAIDLIAACESSVTAQEDAT